MDFNKSNKIGIMKRNGNMDGNGNGNDIILTDGVIENKSSTEFGNDRISKHIASISDSKTAKSTELSKKITEKFMKFKIKPTIEGTIKNLLDDSSVLLNKFLGSASVANVAIKTPELENFDDYAPQSLLCPGPVVKFYEKTPKTQTNVVPRDVEAIPQRSSLYGSDMTTIYDERAPNTNISSHMGFGDVSDRNEKIPDWI